MKVVQVGGSVRSGTTVTGLVLANRDDAIMLGEVMHLFKPYTKLHRKKIEELKADKDWNYILEGGMKCLYTRIFECFPKKLIIDTSKDPFWFSEQKKWNKGKFDINLIVTYKSPDELRASFEKRGNSNWNRVYMNYYRRLFSILTPVASINTKRLLEDSKYIRNVENTLKLSHGSKGVEYWKTEQPNFFGSSTVKKNVIEVLSEDLDDSNRISSPVQIMYSYLQNIDVESKVENRSFPDNIMYNNLMIFILKVKDYYLKKILYNI